MAADSIAPAAPKARNTHGRIVVECGKCFGRGRINAFSHIANGVCFSCGGSGSLGTISREEERQNVVRGLKDTACIVLEAAHDDNEGRAHTYADSMLDGLFRVGTADARKVLDFVAKGEYWCDDGMLSCPAAIAAECRAYIVARGRERVAA